MEELRERLLQRIREIANGSDKNKYKLLNELLTKSFAVIRVKELRPIIMCLLQQLPKIDREYLLVIVQDRELYMEAPVEVKQHIWQDNQALFGDEVSPLLSRFVMHPLTVNHILVECSNLNTIRQRFFSVSSLKDLFDNFDNHVIIDFIKETHFYALV